MPTTNYTNVTLRTLTNDKIIVPFSTTGTGTISTQNTGVVGVGTLFLTELVNGSWIVDLDNNEFRQVVSVQNNTQATLAQAFSTDIPSLSTLELIYKPSPCEICVVVPIGEADATIVTTEEATLPAGLPVNISKANRDNSSARDLISPVIVDATGTEVLISIMY